MRQRSDGASAAGWAADSETGLLREVLLCRPEHYAWQQPINAIITETLARGGTLDQAAAVAQYGELEAALAEAGVVRHYLAPEPHLTSQVFVRDSSLATPWGPVIAQLARPERRGEYAAVVRFHQDAGQAPFGFVTSGTLEGGDVHLLRPGLALIGHSGARTDQAGARQVAAWFEAAGWRVRLQWFPAHFLHLDVLFCMAADDLALICEEVLDDDLAVWLREQGIRLIPVPYRSAMQLGCNVLALGRDRVLAARASQEVNARLRAEGLRVLDPELGLFTMGGGGVHCLTMPLRRERLRPRAVF
jgi:N-dimethylarginine dimethylaminohydrolase